MIINIYFLFREDILVVGRTLESDKLDLNKAFRNYSFSALNLTFQNMSLMHNGK